jgi:hypothetical protein
MNPPFQNIILIIKIAVFAISLGMLGLIFFFLSRTGWMRIRGVQDFVEFSTWKPMGTKKILKLWLKIKERLKSGLESEFKLAVIEADTLLEDVLKKMGYTGDTLAERLKQVPANILTSSDAAIEAHKVRNNIVHDPDYRLELAEAEKAVSLYEKVLTELDFL